jgi:mRNA interferase MazF
VDVVAPRRFDVHLVDFDPTVGSEIRETRPAIIVSPDEANQHLLTVVVVPLTGALRNSPSRVRVRFQGRDGDAIIDQIRTVSRRRLRRRLGNVSGEAQRRIVSTLLDFFG